MRPGVHFSLVDQFQLLPFDLLMPQDCPWLTELLVPSVTDVPVDVEVPLVSERERVVLCEKLSDSDFASLAVRTSRRTSVSPIILAT